ncbi:MAG: 50S ribosomal protein L13 [Spirochaetales bacterium]|nr:50S ribosomal protein L13 [Spirochaetales bacterium]
MKTVYVKPQDVERKWYLIDAEDKILGKVAVEAVKILRGKNKPFFVPHQEIGDFVVIINADKAKVTGGKEEKKMYHRYSGYMGGLRSENYGSLVSRKPTAPMEKAIKGMLPKNRLGRKLFTNVKVYAGSQHPHGAQKPELFEIKK